MQKTTLFLIGTLISTFLSAQNVNIPDFRFKNALLSNRTINTNRDGEISVAEATAYTGTINVSNSRINNLTGIEAFTNITELQCQRNNLRSLNVSANTALKKIWLFNNPVANLDVSKNTALTSLHIDNTSITSIDLTKNTALTELFSRRNRLTSLDVSANGVLKTLYCENNYSLTSLNIANGNNANLNTVVVIRNTNLTCIQHDAGFTPPANWQKDATASWSTNCGTASINDITFNSALKLFPNPVSSVLTVNAGSTAVTYIEIYNMLGKKIRNTKQQSIDVSKLTRGIYSIKIQSAEGNIATKKFIKQ